MDLFWFLATVLTVFGSMMEMYVYQSLLRLVTAESASPVSSGAIADFNQDATADLYVTNFEHEWNPLQLSRRTACWIDAIPEEDLVEDIRPMVGV